MIATIVFFSLLGAAIGGVIALVSRKGLDANEAHLVAREARIRARDRELGIRPGQ